MNRQALSRPSRSRARRCECRLLGNLVLDGKRVPTGRCWLRQSCRDALLGWDGAEGACQREISLDQLRQLLDEGLIERLA